MNKKIKDIEQERTNKILAVAYSIHFNYEEYKEMFHVSCYGLFPNCPICGEDISK